MISTARRIEHANAYLALGLLNEAADELEAIEGLDRLSPAVMSVRCDLYMIGQKLSHTKPPFATSSSRASLVGDQCATDFSHVARNADRARRRCTARDSFGTKVGKNNIGEFARFA